NYQVKETEHFIIKVDGEHDAVLLEMLAEEAERIYPEICRDFDHEPAEKTLVEVFSGHGDFSVRISGRGWIGTVGACTGRVIGMPAPDPLRSGLGMFNWAVVLRHEFAHAVTLAATKNRIPHWFTESCAVWQQPDRRNFQAVRLLLNAVRSNKLYPIKSLSWGFIRPDQKKRGRGARTLAYAQSEWIFEYVVEKKGYDAIIKMLNGFGDGWTQKKVFREILGTTEEQFDRDFRVWAIEQITSWGFDPKPQPRTSGSAARKALKADPKHPRALAVLGSVLVRQRKYDEAIAIAQRLQKVKPRSATSARILADCYLKKHRWPEAIAALEAYKLRLRFDPYGYEKLAKLYMQMGRVDKALPNLIELHRRTMKDPKYARQIADIYRTAEKADQALHYYKQVLNINPYDAGVHKAMTGLYVAGDDYELAIRSMRSACLIEPKNADSWTQLAMVYYQAARASKSSEELSEARAAAQKALELDPESQAGEVLMMINEISK
ncbi:MAG: tetratricopeptide repeat protein, partial [Phycisphaerae bacterium]|nr:tetratricopeptide repeat protein [Phycisphaerae bacterium]